MHLAVVPIVKRGRPRDPRRDAAILDAALELVAEVGYDRMTVERLAARAGVTKPTVYLRWPGGKPDIVAAALVARRAALVAPDAHTGSLRGDLVAYVGALTAGLERNVHLAAGLMSRLRESPELSAVFREHAVLADRARVAAILDRAAARGELDDRAAVTPLFASVAGSIIHTHVLLTGEPVDAAFVDELVDGVLLPILSSRRPA